MTRVQMRCRETIKAWNEMMQNLDQVVMEGGYECRKIFEALKKKGDALGKAVNKTYKNHSK